MTAVGSLSLTRSPPRSQDDFILLNIFVGNDFLPHLPGLHINEGALPLLFGIYKRILPRAGGYINESGKLRTDRLALVLTELTKFERDQFEEEYGDTFIKRQRQQKQSRALDKARAKKKLSMSPSHKAIYEKIKAFILELRVNPHSAPRDLFLPVDLKQDERDFVTELCRMLHLGLTFDEYDPVADLPVTAISSGLGLHDEDEIAAAESEAAITRVLKKYDGARVEDDDGQSAGEDDEEAEYERMLDQKMTAWKRDYYKNKLEIDYADKAAMKQLAYRYIEGLQWVLHYYYEGVASWGWFYDYHYAPKISDLLEVEGMTFDFDLGKPFRPFDQLMGVLPALSSQHIPSAFRDLMTDPASPIIDFYPANFEADLNGKKQDWEAVVKIPFIDEKRLLKALDSRAGLLSIEEKSRNGFGVSWKCSYDAEQEHFYPSSLPGVFPDIVHSRAKVEAFHLPELKGRDLVKGLAEGANLGERALAGFPSIKTLPHYARLGYHGVSVFQGESKGESVVVTIENTYEDAKIGDLADIFVGKRSFISWPFLQEGLVIAVSDSLFRYEMGIIGGAKKIIKNPHSAEAQLAWKRKAGKIEHHYNKRFAIVTGDVEVLLHVRPLKGLRRLVDGSFVKEYEESADKEVEQAVQMCVPNVTHEDNRFIEQPALPLHEEFPEHSKVFFLGDNAYGAPAAVLGSTQQILAIEMAIFVDQPKEVRFFRQLVEQRARERYYPSFQVSKMCGLSGLAVSKMTSSMLLDLPEGGRINVGLNLKFEAKGQKVLGYSRKGAAGWEFSDKAVALINEYKQLFPEIPQAIMAKSNEDLRAATQFFGAQAAPQRTQQLKQWIKEKGVRDLEAVPLFAEQLGKDTVASIEAMAGRMAAARTKDSIRRVVFKGIPRTALLKPSHSQFRLQAQRFELGDRVVAVSDSGTVPMSARGVVVGLGTATVDVVFDGAFLSGTTLDGRCTSHMGATVSFSQVLNVSQPQFAVSCSGKDVDARAEAAGRVADNALERTIGPIQPNGMPAASANGGRGGHTNGANGGGGLGGNPSSRNYRPPSHFTPAPAPRGGAPPTIMKRGGHNGAGNAPASVRNDTHFSKVASGSAKPSVEEAQRRKLQQQQQQGVNALLAGLNMGAAGGSNGNGHQNGHTAQARGGAPPTGPRGGRGGGRGRGGRGRGA